MRLRTLIADEWLLALSGAASIIVAFLLVAFPRAGALSVVRVIGVHAVIVGGLMIALAFRLRFWSKDQPGAGEGRSRHAHSV